MREHKKSAPQLIAEIKRSMKCCNDTKMIEEYFNFGCRVQSTAFPSYCGRKDCRYCFLEREKNNALENVKMGIDVSIFKES